MQYKNAPKNISDIFKVRMLGFETFIFAQPKSVEELSSLLKETKYALISPECLINLGFECIHDDDGFGDIFTRWSLKGTHFYGYEDDQFPGFVDIG